MSDPPRDAAVDQQAEAAANEAIAVCPKCGTKIPASRPVDLCPVCLLRGALNPDAESVRTTFEIGAGGVLAARQGITERFDQLPALDPR
jgi:hypothetical protein